MLFKQNSLTIIPDAFASQMYNKTLKRVNSFKYLGITLQEDSKWGIQVDSICRKIIGFSSVMNKLGNKMYSSTRLSIYYSMIQSHFAYLQPVWGNSATQNDINRLQVAQNQAIRKIFCHDTKQTRNKYKLLNARQQISHTL